MKFSAELVPDVDGLEESFTFGGFATAQPPVLIGFERWPADKAIQAVVYATLSIGTSCCASGFSVENWDDVVYSCADCGSEEAVPDVWDLAMVQHTEFLVASGDVLPASKDFKPVQAVLQDWLQTSALSPLEVVIVAAELESALIVFPIGKISELIAADAEITSGLVLPMDPRTKATAS